MTIDVRKLRYFVAVFEEGSFTRAAKRENVVQPTLSVQITHLEEELSVKLLERSAQGVKPTHAGERYYKRCIQILNDLEIAAQEMRDLSGRVTGLIRIGVMPSICHGPLFAIVNRYTARYPDVELRFQEGLSGVLADAVVAGELDFAVGNRPVPLTQLTYREVLNDRLILISGSQKELPRWKPYRLNEVPNLKLIVPSLRQAQRRLINEHIASGTIQADQFLEVDGVLASLNVVRGSDWSVLLPTVALLNESDSEDLVINPIEAPILASDIFEMHLTNAPLSLPAQCFVDLLHDALSEIAPTLGKPRNHSGV
ncbi:LysR family transcriptional regulator [Bosea sp. (in: a-proteobacteria)]|uniref:LysR family transcriptional regulator n=1 Tax=Bosea sp. (in: a-proteobacteria) TaxID=1871050 RepID=UPI002DDD11FE|nr:LysR family transcriptional regulator [Bosea sp. (in: a-proteobacteria)]HEV2510330.1 LysR family transcriptional regulator [Bosea sp. (in: a-proteobacteria)]